MQMCERVCELYYPLLHINANNFAGSLRFNPHVEYFFFPAEVNVIRSGRTLIRKYSASHRLSSSESYYPFVTFITEPIYSRCQHNVLAEI